MTENSRATEIRVGLFVLVGLLIIAFMAVQFGRLGQGLQKYYSVTLRLPNAGGILKGSDVLLSGARIGHVAEKPVIDETLAAVRVRINIIDDIRLPKGTRFSVGSSGLLGDRFINVALPKDFEAASFKDGDPAQVLQDGAIVQGVKAGGGISELTEKGGKAVEDLQEGLQKIQDLTERLNSQLLSDENLGNLKETFTNLKLTSERFATASTELNNVLSKAGGTIERAGGAVDKASSTMEKAEEAAVSLQAAIADARKVLQSAQSAVTEAREGDGVIAKLLSDGELSQNLEALVSNLRRHGVLFYRDSAKAEPKIRRAIPTGRPPNRR